MGSEFYLITRTASETANRIPARQLSAHRCGGGGGSQRSQLGVEVAEQVHVAVAVDVPALFVAEGQTGLRCLPTKRQGPRLATGGRAERRATNTATGTLAHPLAVDHLLTVARLDVDTDGRGLAGHEER